MTKRHPSILAWVFPLLLSSFQVLLFQIEPVLAQLPSPVHEYNFDEKGGSTVYDSKGGKHGTIVGSGHNWGHPETGQAFSWLGLNGAAWVELPGGILNGYTDVTIELRVAVRGAANWQRAFDFGRTDPTTGHGKNFFYLILQRGWYTDWQEVGLGTGNDVGSGEGAQKMHINYGLQNYVWYHFTVVYAASNTYPPTLSYYINGGDLKTQHLVTSAPNLFHLGSTVAEDHAYLGRSSFNADAKSRLQYDFVKIYNRAFTPEQVKTSYLLNTYPSQVAVSGNGKYVYVSAGGNLYFMDGKMNDGSWKKLTGTNLHLKHVAVDDNNRVYTVSDDNDHIHYSNTPSPNSEITTASFTQLQGYLEALAIAADGTRLVGHNKWNNGWGRPIIVAADGSSYDYSPSWKILAAGHQNVAVNGDGTVTVGSNNNGALYMQKFAQGGDAVGSLLPLSNPLGVASSVPWETAIGGLEDLWVAHPTTHNIYHGTINIATNSVDNWKLVDGKMLQIAATAEGAVYGISEDKRGILYCHQKEAVNHDFTCYYLVSPLSMEMKTVVENSSKGPFYENLVDTQGW